MKNTQPIVVAVSISATLTVLLIYLAFRSFGLLVVQSDIDQNYEAIAALERQIEQLEGNTQRFLVVDPSVIMQPEYIGAEGERTDEAIDRFLENVSALVNDGHIVIHSEALYGYPPALLVPAEALWNGPKMGTVNE